MLVGGSGDTPGVTHVPTQVVAWQGFSKPPLLYPPVHCPGSRTLLWSVDLHFTVLSGFNQKLLFPFRENFFLGHQIPLGAAVSRALKYISTV